MADHSELTDGGSIAHHLIDELLPVAYERNRLRIIGEQAPITVTGHRNIPEEALRNLLIALDTLGLIVNDTSED